VNAQDFFEKALLVNYASIAGAFVSGVIRRRSLDSNQRLLFMLVACVLLTEVIGRILWSLGTNNLFLYHFYSVVEFILLGTVYARNLQGLIKPVYLYALIASFVLFAVINTVFFQGLTEFNSHVTFVESLLLIGLALAYFYKLLRDTEHRKLERVPTFWINMSVLTYFSGAFLLFHVANELIAFPAEERTALWGTHALFNVVHYLLYAIALWVKPETLQPAIVTN
jgi:hypothetical protein